MKKKKNKVLVISLIAILLIAGIITFYFLKNFNNKNKLTLTENKWIESNKYNVIDVSVMNDVPILSYDGDGLVYDYLNYVTENLSLNFNIVPYKFDGISNYKYKTEIVDKVSDEDIVLLKDHMILITIDGKQYRNIEDIDNIKVGILKSNKEFLENYFKDKNIKFIEFDSYDDLKNALSMSKSSKIGTNSNSTNNTTNKNNTTLSGSSTNKNNQITIDGTIVLKTIFTKEIIENDYSVSFQFNDLNKYFVLTTNGDKELNNILHKKYNVWKEKNYSKQYSDNLLSDYFDFKQISDAEQKKLKSKSYTYGFIDYGIYNNLEKNKISGLTGLILKDFNKLFGISITYTKYNGLSKLLKDFNSKKIDFMLNISDVNNYKTEPFNTVGILNKRIAVISGIDNKNTIDNINSLKDKKVLTVKDSYLERYLIDNGVKVESYNNMKDLTKNYGNSDIVIVDLENYDYYKSSSFKNSRINYILDIDDKYNYVINDTNENEIFRDLFNFYLSYVSINDLVANNYESIAYKNFNITYILLLIIIVLVIYVVVDFSTHIKVMIKRTKKNKKINLTKEEKIKYIDQLTSLKNRAYLNSKIESWDESEVYPQSIVIIDLNNISYINDNYGREEGDKVITEAANILIMHQLKNSEIIRTDGNEFLIYLVGYNEKQVISYLRKLNKELKSLSHGFGAASGYSIITDAIKTVDDAVNEATLDMKNNKEDIDY